MTSNGDRASRDHVLAELRDAEKLVVVAHENPDGDARSPLLVTGRLLLGGALGEQAADAHAPIDGTVVLER